MARLTEAALRAEITSGKFRQLYFLYGEEDFLVKMYTDMIAAETVPEESREMNYVKYTKPPKADELYDILQNVPFFAEYKCVVIEDLDIDGMNTADSGAYFDVIKDIPDSAVLVISQKNITIDPKKPKEKTKKLLAVCDGAGAVCEFNRLSVNQLIGMTASKFSRSGCSISEKNARLLIEECGSSLTVMQIEIEKLCVYKKSGEITRDDIENLVPHRIETNIYNLAKELFAGRTSSALHIIDDLFAQRVNASYIGTTMASHFTDLYRAKLGQLAKKSSNDAAQAFGYYGRAFVMSSAYSSVRNLSLGYLGSCVEILYRMNKLLNSSAADGRVLVERAVTEIAALKKL